VQDKKSHHHPHSLTGTDPRNSSHPYGSRYGTEPIPKYSVPSKGTSAQNAYQIIHDELTLDGNPQLSALPLPIL
jgi:glutamate decarboxylase